MNTQSSNGWPPPSGGGVSNTEHGPAQQRQPGAFGPNQPQPIHQSASSQINGPAILNPSGPFFPSQSNGQTLPNPQQLPPAPPLQPPRGPPSIQQQSPPSVQQHLVHHPGYSVSTIGPPTQSPQAAANAEREYERERLREQERGQRMHQELLAQQRFDQEAELLHRQREQQQREQQQQEQLPSPRENHIGPIPIQQPIASRVPATLHGPNGILNDQHPGIGVPQPQPPVPLGAPSGPGNVFGSGVQAASDSLRPFPQQVSQSVPPQQLLGFNNVATPQQLPNQVTQLTQGQQPILNDALSYLDQVKVRFVQQPDVYNQFLDIMKDFKSQAIDTPGVIDRVSSLFAGHPELIQGFNTFLPPGYRIECGTMDDPNAIRVTTPMGTTVSQMPSAPHRVNGVPNGIVALDNARRDGFQDAPQVSIEWPNSQQHDDEAAGDNLANARRGGHAVFSIENANLENGIPYEGDDPVRASHAALLTHQQEQRGVSNLSNAVTAVTTNGGQSRQALTQVSPGGGQVTTLGQAVAGLSNAAMTPGSQLAEKRGPVEFNHAIGYVNKIKTRFHDKPEIYKQFLEILQTYQRESKPIGDVYAQVTHLFNTAPDLLEDFKQFLPESAAYAQSQADARQANEDAVMLSNVRGEAIGHVQSSQVHTPRPEMKMPPVGNFAPPSATKDSKKRRGGPGSHLTGGAAAIDIAAGPSGQGNRNGRGNANKRARVEPAKPAVAEAPPVSPSLVPNLPSPMPPTKDVSGISEQLTFFDRVKKFVADKKTFNEFLKLCNLFTQDLIDKNTLMHKAYNFIGGNAELVNWFKNFIQFDGRDEIIENKPKIPGDKVVLSNCRGLGPSYRLLPKRERLRPCGGRDDLCRQVLNDEWVSHPTWASEDSGFVAHRKNLFEEALHRIEEERHDYDINIEACLRTIQLIEPIVQQMQMMGDNERKAYVLPRGIGGQSETIYQRIIKKIYTRDRGRTVISDMFRRPSAVLPVLLGRLKEKAEEWKASQREWEKVWRDQTNKIFWKSLDHQGIAAKKEDKRQFQPKTLHTDITVRYEEQRRQRNVPWMVVPRHQFEYSFEDVDVIYDSCHVILTQLHQNFTGNDIDKSRLETFLSTFIPTFFDIDRDIFQAKMSDIYDSSPPNEVEDEPVPNDDSNGGRSRRAVNGNGNGRKPNLLRGVLERGRPGPKEDSVMESKETTPDQSHDEDTPASTGTPNEHPRVDEAEHRWMSHPSMGSRTQDSNTPFQRSNFHLYANLNIYCFFRVFQMLYERLLYIKMSEEEVKVDVRDGQLAKPAHELNWIERKPSEFFADVSPNANHYQQVLVMIEDVIKQDEDVGVLEETLRRFYMQKGWQLFSFDKMLSALLRFALNILVSDNKDKSLDIINLFYKDRKEEETTFNAELTYRKQVDKLVKEGDVYRIRYNRLKKNALIQVFKKDEKTYEADELAAEQRWSYYISTFTMRDLTEGIPLAKLQFPLLKRNLPAPLADEDEYTSLYGSPQWNEDGLTFRISQDNYHILYDPDTSEWWVHNNAVRKRGLSAYEAVKKQRKDNFETLFGENGKLIVAKDGIRQFEEENTAFKHLIQDGPSNDGTNDEVMGGT